MKLLNVYYQMWLRGFTLPLIFLFTFNFLSAKEYIVISTYEGPNIAYKLEPNSSITFNGEVAELSFDNSTLLLSEIKSISYVDDLSGAISVETEGILRIQYNNQTLSIEGATNETKGYIYNLEGTEVRQLSIPCQIDMSVYGSGLYIVSVNGYSLKILNK